MCPHCRQNAPVVYRGVAAYCAACGAPRLPLTGSALQLAGQPSRIGSVLARVLGWIVLSVGLAVALSIGLIAHALFPAGVAGLLIGGPIALLSVVLGVILLRGGARLDRSGATAERDARAQAVFALAAHRGGSLTALDVATALDLRLPDAEALLQSLAKEQYEHVGVEVDPSGTLVYRFLLPAPADPARVRVDPEIARSPNRAEWERLEAVEAEQKTRAARDPSRAPR